MSYRITNTEKWKDVWFADLSPFAKLLFFYFVENCDNAGFFEVNKKFILFHTGLTEEQLSSAGAELKKSYIKSKDGTKLWFRNFLKYQRKLPLNIANNSHKPIIALIQDNLSDETKFKGNSVISSLLPNELQSNKLKRIKKENTDSKESLNTTNLSEKNLFNTVGENKEQNVSTGQNEQTLNVDSSKRFVKPLPKDIYEYMAENEFEFAKQESLRFFNFYESNGWKIGKNPMKRWKSAVANWMVNYYERHKISTPKISKLQALQNASDAIEGIDWNEVYKDSKNEQFN